MNLKLINLNSFNGDDQVLFDLQKRMLNEFKGKIYGAEFGVAYCGGIEGACKIFGKRGFMYALDTFTGHPEHLSKDVNSFEARCMDNWYIAFGKEKLSVEYIDAVLKSEGLENYKLIKGEVHKDSLKNVKKLHYVLLDLDLIEPMKTAYEAIKDKLVPGSYICIHDVIPADHLPDIHKWWYEEVMTSGLYEEIGFGKYLGIYKVK